MAQSVQSCPPAAPPQGAPISAITVSAKLVILPLVPPEAEGLGRPALAGVLVLHMPWVQIPALPFISCVTLGELCHPWPVLCSTFKDDMGKSTHSVMFLITVIPSYPLLRGPGDRAQRPLREALPTHPQHRAGKEPK